MNAPHPRVLYRPTIALCLLVVTAVIHAQDHPNVARGLSAESAYQLGAADSINLFNGNLIVPIPIGPQYRVGANLSYGLTLVYNGQVWGYRYADPYNVAVAQSHQNVALGWLLTLGELVAPDYTNSAYAEPEHDWSYLSPDGSRHLFGNVLHREEETTEFAAGLSGGRIAGYSRDSSYMRLVKGPVTEGPAGVFRFHYTVEMADGTMHQFRSSDAPLNSDTKGLARRYFLERIADRHGNTVTISYLGRTPDNPALHPVAPEDATLWEIADNSNPDTSHPRTHRVILNDAPFTYLWTLGTAAIESRKFVTSVQLASFHGQVAEYKFDNYAAGNPNAHFRAMSEPCKSSVTRTGDRATFNRFLDGIELPDKTTYRFDYVYGDGQNCHDAAGHLARQTLPTGATVSYAVGGRLFPQFMAKEAEDIYLAPAVLKLGYPTNAGWRDIYRSTTSPIDDWQPKNHREFRSPYYSSVAIAEKVVDAGDAGGPATWTYLTCFRNRPPGLRLVDGVNRPKAPRELVVAADEIPANRRTLSYFTVSLSMPYAGEDDTAFPDGTVMEYGLPFTRTVDPAKASPVPGYFLSTEVMDSIPPKLEEPLCEIAFDDSHVMQRQYVRYEGDVFPSFGPSDGSGGRTDNNRRLAGTLTVNRRSVGGLWVDDRSCGASSPGANDGEICYSLTEYSDFDGLGHYRKTTTRSNIGTSLVRTVTTKWRRPAKTPYSYVPAAANDPDQYMVRIDEPWLPNFFDTVRMKNQGEPEFVATQSCLDPGTGFLSRRIAFDDETHFTATSFEPDGRGNVESEAFARGTANDDALANCTTTLTPEYTFHHSYRYGTRETTVVDNVASRDIVTGEIVHRNAVMLDLDADPSTGLPLRSRDTAELETTFTFDIRGRLTSTSMPGETSTKRPTVSYVYDGASSPPHVTVTGYSSGTPENLFKESHYYYDKLGRLIQSKTRMPGGWSTRAFTYGAGLQRSASVAQFTSTPEYSPSFSAPVTAFTYDAFNRVVMSVAPDGARNLANYPYAGAIERSLQDGGGGIAWQSLSRADGFGRLIQVTEYLDSTNTPAVTSYEYDATDHLARVIAGSQPPRTFAYSRSGLLMAEDHPESARTTYEYDALGSLKTKRIGTEVELTFDYDAAGRPTSVTARDGIAKEFSYGTSGLQLGRRDQQRRHNRLGNIDYQVLDEFQYGATGQVTQKSTTVTQTNASGQAIAPPDTFHQTFQYTENGLPATLSFPVCDTCGIPPSEQSSRELELSYENDLLANVKGVTTAIPLSAGIPWRTPNGVEGIAYTAGGMVQAVQHASSLATGLGVLDRYAPDPSGLPRPASITFEGFCSTILTQPSSQIIAAGETATFDIQVADGVTVQWYQGTVGDTSRPLSGGASFTTPALLETTLYWARASASGGCSSDSLQISAVVCKPLAVTYPAEDAIALAEIAAGSANHALIAEASSTAVDYAWSEVWEDAATHRIESRFLGATTTLSYTAPSQSGIREVWIAVTDRCGKTAKRLVARFNIVQKNPEEVECRATFAVAPPSSIATAVSGESTRLEARLDYSSATIRRHFEWTYAGQKKAQTFESDEPASALATFTYAVRTQSVVRLKAWAECAGGAISEPVFSETFGIAYGDCPVPEVSVSPVQGIFLEPYSGVTTARFVASCAWPGVQYEWYRGESGTTLNPIVEVTTNELVVDAHPEDYWVRVVTECGSHYDSATLTVSSPHCVPVRLTKQPQSVNVKAGQSFTLAAEATGTPAPRSGTADYQWYRNGVPLVAATPTHLPSLTTETNETATYSLRAGNNCHFTMSRIATVHVTECAAITVSQQPADLSIVEGETRTLTVQASAASTLQYRWYSGESGDTSHPVPNGTTASLTITPAQTAQYWVRIDFGDSNRCAVDSRIVTVTVCRKPKTVAKSANPTSSFAGQQQTLTVTMAGDALSYSWYQGDVEDTGHVVGVGQDVIRVSPTNTTKYWVRVTSDCAAGQTERVTDEAFTVYVCPKLLADPLPVTVMAGTPAVLTLQASDVERVEWYRGKSGDETGGIIGTSTALTFTTPVITADTEFWARVYSGSCFRNTATVLVATCKEPRAGWSAAIQKQIAPGDGVTLRADVAPDAGVSKTFYEGMAGDLANSTRIHGPGADSSLPVAPTVTTRYWVRAQLVDGSCYADTNTLTIEVCRPVITVQPQAKMIDRVTNPAATVTLSVTAAGAPLTYQWYEGASGVTTNPVPGGTGASVAVAPSVATSYWVRVSGTCGSLDSEAAVVTQCAKAEVVQLTPSQIVAAGSTTTLTVTATGTDLHYQWYRGAAGVTTTPVGTDAGSYPASASTTTEHWVRITGMCGAAANSQTVRLSVPAVITAQPIGAAITSETSATLSVSASGTYLTYQWYAGPGVTSKIPGATSSTYVTPALTADASYWCRVSSGEAFTDSNVATVTICAPRAISVTNETRIAGQPVQLGIAGGAQANETYEWYEGESGNTAVRVSTAVAVTVTPTETTKYWLRTIRPSCTANSARITVTVCTPAIASQPAGSMVNPGASATMTVAAIGPQPLSYQWYAGPSGVTSTPIPNATGSSYTASPAADTSYWVQVRSAGGCTTNSDAALVAVCKPPAVSQHPSSNVVHAGASHTLSVTATGTDLHYQWFRGATGDTAAPVGTDADTYTATITTTVDYWVRATGRCGPSANSNTARLSVAPKITTQPVNISIMSGTAASLSVAATGTFMTYQWYAGSGTNGLIAGATSATYATPPLTSAASYWCRITSGLASTDSTMATVSVCQPRSITVSNATQVSGDAVSLTVTGGSSSGETYEWYEGASGDMTKRLVTDAFVIVSPTQTTNYWLRTIRASCTANSSTVTVKVCVPSITSQPASPTVTSGNSAALSVTATGTPPLSYQWYAGTSGDTSTPIAGATSSSLTITPAVTTSYWVNVSSTYEGAGCRKASNTATVTVCRKPFVAEQPRDNVISSSSSVVLSVTATGDGLSYQWYTGAAGVTTTPIGANSNTLTVTPGSTKSYWVRVSGTCGVTDSVAALQSVTPSITKQPADAASCANQPVTLTTTVSGTLLGYQWYRGNVFDYSQPIDGAAGASTTVAPAATQGYWCEITSGAAKAATRTATVTVSAGPAALTPSKTLSGSCYKLTARVSASDDGLVQYQWFQGPLGDTSNPVSINPVYTACPATTTTYWVRITYTGGSHCWTDKSVIVP